MASVAAYRFAQLDATPELRRAEDVLSAAWAEADEVRERARSEGFAAGHAEGLAAAAGELAPVVAALREAARAVRTQGDELCAVLETQAAELSLIVAEHILGGALAVEPERLLEVTRSALRRLSDRHRVTVVVHPEDLDLVGAASEALRTELGGIDQLDVQTDRRIGPGGVSVHTAFGEIDATLRSQLESAQGIVMAALSGAAETGGEGVGEVGGEGVA